MQTIPKKMNANFNQPHQPATLPTTGGLTPHLIAWFGLFFIFCFSAVATQPAAELPTPPATPVLVALDPEEATSEIKPEDALTIIETYFNALQTFEANFHQVSEAAQVGSSSLRGTFYLHRPRKFLWQYTTPSQQRLVSTGGQLFFHDPDTLQTTQLPLNSGVAGFLTAPHIQLKNDYFSPSGVHITPKSLEVDLKAKENDMAVQQLSITLWRHPVRLGKLTTTDQLGRKTYTFFSDIKEGQPIPAQHFQFDPFNPNKD